MVITLYLILNFLFPNCYINIEKIDANKQGKYALCDALSVKITSTIFIYSEIQKRLSMLNNESLLF